MESSTPRAPSMLCSSSGLEMAASAASTARLSPRALPMPMSALPAPLMTLFTSAKSRLIRPGVVIRSVMPWTPLREHLVGLTERVHHADAAVTEREQPIVRDDDQGVALVTQLFDADLGLHLAALALEGERPGDDADGEGADLPRDVADDRGAAGAGATAFAARHEHHVGAAKHLFDLFLVVFGRVLADVGVGARAEATGQLAADVELDVGVAHEQRLCVGVDGDELNALEADLDHAVDGVNTATANADDLDDRQVIVRRCHRHPSLLANISASRVPRRSHDGRD